VTVVFKKIVDPTRVRLSPHFLLSDFMGSHSVYAKGFANIFDMNGADNRIPNLQALCEHALEPLLEKYGPMSISYGVISPSLSRKIVTYMDPDQPSHHRADKGAACDFVSHRWVAGEFPTIDDLYLPESARGSPIALAHTIDQMDVPYSRLITYSESPYLCIAVSAEEVAQGHPRKAFYENKFNGVPKAKPQYTQLSNATARRKHLQKLQEHGLEHDWRGGGFPSVHGGGKRQYQHMRVSRYSMVSDFLFHTESVREGEKNIPCMHLDSVQDAFAASGLVYDWLLDNLGLPRLSITKAYVSHVNPFNNDQGDDWRRNSIRFSASIHEAETLHFALLNPPPGVNFNIDDGTELTVEIDVNEVLTNPAWDTTPEEMK
jgi:hypothetical protein